MNTPTQSADPRGNRGSRQIIPITLTRLLPIFSFVIFLADPSRAEEPPAPPEPAATEAAPPPATPESTASAGTELEFTISAPVPRPAVPWEGRRFDYAVVDQDLREVLTEFGRRVGLSVAISDAVRGRVRGRLPALPARALLEQLAAMHGFDWFSDGATLHISASSEAVSRLVELGRVSPRALGAALGSLGIVDERWPIRIASGGLGLAILAGPPRYVALIEQTLAALARRETPAATVAPAGTIRIFRGRTERGT